MLYNPPSGSTDTNASYVGKNVAAGTQGSRIPPAAVEAPQRELMAIINQGQALGLSAPSNTDLAQMLKVIRSGLLDYFVATGSPDAVTIAPSIVYAALVTGMKFRVKIAGTGANATTTPVLTVNGLTAPIVLQGGGKVSTGDINGGRTITFQIDDAGNARFVGTAPSESGGATPTLINNFLIVGGRYQAFTTPGPWSLTLDPNATVFRARVWAPGAGGGGANGPNAAGSGGGGGDYEEGIFPCPRNSVLSGVIGAAGQGGAAGGNDGTSGGATTLLLNGSALISALGGGGGKGSTSGGVNVGGTAGTGSGGQKQRPGGGGGFPYFVSDGSTTRGIGGAGGSAYTSSGTPPNLAAQGNGGSFPGGGGSGASNNAAGGNGGAALIEIEH